MQYIKVLATNSTNSDLKRCFYKNNLKTNTCLSTQHQTKGRGQRNANWQTEKNKNLTFSVLLTNLNLKLKENFKLSALVSIAITEFLRKNLAPDTFSVKWPNDILADKKKICGILIENIVSGNQIKHSIIGVGLNVNQKTFPNLPRASSLKSITHRHFNLDELLIQCTETIETEVYCGIELPIEQVLSNYESFLLHLHKTATFEFPNGKQVKGIIRGVDLSGHLKIEIKQKEHFFDLKEIKLIY